MTTWPEKLEEWIEQHPDHILYKAAQLRYRESEVLLKDGTPFSPIPWDHALAAVISTMIYYRRIHEIEDFEACAEETFRQYVKRRLKG